MTLLKSMCRSWYGLRGCVQILLLALAFSVASPALAGGEPKRVFLLQGLAGTQPASQQTIEAVRARLSERSSENIEVYTDYLDLGRFPGPEHEERLVRFLRSKFAQVSPDLIIPVSRGATSFAVRHRTEFAPGIPMIYCCTPTSITDGLDLPADIPGVLIAYDWTGTLALAERLQPDAKTLVIVSGASPADHRWQQDAIRELQPFLHKYQTKFLSGLGYDALVKEVSRLPRDTIVILTPIFDDGLGQGRIASDVAVAVAKASSAPTYSPVATLFGGGVVGGNMDSYMEQGAKVADLALEILAGKNPSSLPHQTRLPIRYRVDARQLDRWGMTDASLPRASIEFRQPGLWEQHKSLIISTLLGGAALVGIIALLLMQERRRRVVEKALKESEDRMAFAASSTKIGFWRMDIATGQLWASEHCRAMFGIVPDAPLSWDQFQSAVHAEDRHTFWTFLQCRSPAGLPIGEFRVSLPGQSTRWFSCRGRAVSDELGMPLQVGGVFADITARKSAEGDAELQRKEITHLMRVAVLGELSGGIAHELSQPLAAILANAQAGLGMLSKTAHDKETIAEILEDIVEEDRRAGEVIHRLRRLLTKGERQSAAIDLNGLVRSTLGLLHSELINRKIKVDVDLKPELPLISGDAVQIQQVLLNLIMNAMEAMDSTAASLRRLSISTRATEAGYAEIQVSDHGRGIGAEELGHLFQPFFTTKERGLGLGLSICSTIVTSHGGRLSITNASKGGAKAVILLPAPVALAAAS